MKKIILIRAASAIAVAATLSGCVVAPIETRYGPAGQTAVYVKLCCDDSGPGARVDLRPNDGGWKSPDQQWRKTWP